jgi:hypothetical protein
LRKAKTPTQSESDFTVDELEIINEITITLALVFEEIIKNVNASDMLQQTSKMASSLKYQTTYAYAIKLQSLYEEKGRFPDEIKEELAKMLSEDRQRALLTNESMMSKVLKNFDDDGITLKIKGDKDIKAQSPRSVKRKPKVGKPRRVGPHIISKLTTTVEDYKRILSNSKALGLISRKLLNYGLLGEVYSKIIKESFHAFQNGDENFYNYLNMFKSLFPNVADTSPKLFQVRIKQLTEAKMENLQKEAIAHLVENPSYPLFFIFSLYKFGNHGS